MKTAENAENISLTIHEGAKLAETLPARLSGPGKYDLSVEESKDDGKGSGIQTYHFETYSGLTSDEISQQLAYLDSDLQSHEVDISAMLARSGGGLDDMINIAGMQRRIAIARFEKILIMSGHFFITDAKGVYELSRFYKRHAPMDMPFILFDERFVVRKERTLNIVLPIDIRLDPDMSRAWDLERQLKTDRLRQIAEEFNNKTAEDRMAAYNEVERLRSMLKSAPEADRFKLRQAINRIHPIGAWISPKSYRLVTR